MRHALALALLLLAAPAGAATIVLDFEEEAIGDHSDSFASAECGGCVELQGVNGRHLFVGPFDGSLALTIGEEGGTLVLTFLVPVVGLSLDFGGDAGAAEVRSGLAILTGMAGGVPVALDDVTSNRNLAIDQTLAIAFASPIDSAIFEFGQIGEFEPVSSIVDRIVLTTVPEPGTLALVTLAGFALASSRFRPDAS